MILTKREPITHVLDAYEAFNARRPGWLKVELQPSELPAGSYGTDTAGATAGTDVPEEQGRDYAELDREDALDETARETSA